MVQTTVIDVLTAQHAQVKKLLGSIASGGDDVEDSFCELDRMVAVHETAEEEVVYPPLRSSGADGQRVVEARMKEEEEGTKVLTQLEDMRPGSPEFAELFQKFRQAVLDHAEVEEREVFPLLRSTQTPERLAEMAKAFDVAERAAPKHDHPHGGGSGGSRIATPASAIAKDVRAALRQR